MPGENKNRQEIENQLRQDFNEILKRLQELSNEVQAETDETKKEEEKKKLEEAKEEALKIKKELDNQSGLEEEQLTQLRTRIDKLRDSFLKQVKRKTAEILTKRYPTPTTYELLKNSETCEKLKQIILLNPKEFDHIPVYGPENKLEYIFSKIRNGVKLFLNNKLGESSKYDQIIDNTMAPALEWSMLEMLKNQGNETNVSMLNGMNEITWDSFNNLANGIYQFASNAKSSFNKFSQWVNAIDYISIHNEVLEDSNKSQVLTNPVEFKAYLNDPVFASPDFSPYKKIDKDLFKINENQNFEFGVSIQEKLDILDQIGNIQVVNSPKTTALISKMIDKPEKFFGATKGLQKVSNTVLDSVNMINSVTKLFGKDLMGEICKEPGDRGLIYKVLDFVCKLIGITGGLEGIVKKRRLDKLMLTGEKKKNIGNIMQEYINVVGEGENISIVDSTSCSSVLSNFTLSDLNDKPTTKGDHLRDIISENVDINLISPSVVKETIGEDYIIKGTTTDGKQQEIVDSGKIIKDDKKRELAHIHINNMKRHLETNYDSLTDFYPNIHNTNDLAVCMVASIYANKEDVVEGIKAKVFLPENYGVVYSRNTPENGGNTPEGGGNSAENQENGTDIKNNLNTESFNLTPDEKKELENLIEKSKKPNQINYLENPIYVKFLHIIENDLNLPKHSLKCVCFQESKGCLYSRKTNKITRSGAGAQGLFQFMPDTANLYMKNNLLKEKYGKTFTSRDSFIKDPLATARAAGILLHTSMKKYNFQTTLACYNMGEHGYETKIGKRNLRSGDFQRLSKETRDYVRNISLDILKHNGVSGGDPLADLGKYSRNGGDSNNVFWA